MKIPPSILLSVLCALLAHSTSAATLSAFRDADLTVSLSSVEAAPRLSDDLTIAASLEASEFDSRQRGHEGSVEHHEEPSELLGAYVWVSDTTGIRSSDEDGETPEEGNSGEEKDFGSSPAPISKDRRRAGILSILGAIVVTTGLLYGGYTHRERVRGTITSIPERLRGLSIRDINFKKMHWPTLSMPTISAPQRTRRRRLHRTKGGFRPHVSRLRAWADAERGLLDDYDYDGDYERGPLHSFSSKSSSTSSSSDSNTHEAQAFDLGADEDFMIGAPRRASSLSGSTPPSASGKPVRGMERVWGRWKAVSVKNSKKSRRSNNTNGGGEGTVLFAVAEADDLDNLELETDEALPLAPTPRRFGNGLSSVKVYGSAG